ncbi:unnamed protein product [Orchesella dallaii]|uniref:DUF4789 domain-containing protein n=1 Tax=Orchesella dallaii TaxID=48710 RepID=A0ABP1Q6L1_9HEXA
MWNYKNSDKINILLVIISTVASSCLASSYYRTQTIQERIVSDLEIIESPNGVPLDFNYNETSSESGTFPSVPGCPKSIDGYPWVYFGNPPRCYLSGYPGPCPGYRYLFIENGSPYGICGCGCFKYYMEEGLSDLIETSPNGQYKFCGRTQGYDSHKKICYTLSERGPCAPGQWFVRSKSDSLTCIAECPIVDGGWQVYNPETDQCEQSFGGGGAGGGSAGYITPNDCLAKERYSSILKKCVPKRAGNTLVLG